MATTRWIWKSSGKSRRNTPRSWRAIWKRLCRNRQTGTLIEPAWLSSSGLSAGTRRTKILLSMQITPAITEGVVNDELLGFHLEDGRFISVPPCILSDARTGDVEGARAIR